MTLLLAAAGWLTLSIAAAMLLSPVAGWLKRRAVEDPTPDDLMGVADAVREPDGYQHECGDAEYCSCLTPRGNPQPTYGQERLYDATGLVQVGLAMVHRRCADARRDAATDHICEPCGRLFGSGVAA